MLVAIVKPNLYQDSVALMQIAARLKAVEGISGASLMMGTEPNKEILRQAGLLTVQGEAAGANDLIVALAGEEDAVERAREDAEGLLQGKRSAGSGERKERAAQTIDEGLEALPEANFALISTPGLYAAGEARKALLRGLHVMIFSDNVSIEEERELKSLAAGRGLLVMGPDCGTAIVDGVPLGFANVVRRGPIGVVGASGTGMQEITSLVDRYGSGISHALGTGSHDLSPEIGGLMTIQGLRALLDDPATEVVVLISKPPHPDVAARVLDVAAAGGKQVVVIFLGAGRELAEKHARPGLRFAATLEDAARTAASLAGSPPREATDGALLPERNTRLQPGRRYVRGLFSGGTFCSEAVVILSAELGEVYSNVSIKQGRPLPGLARGLGHTCLDMGADEFTVGRPHPMIDMSARIDRIDQESRDPEVGVLLLDVVLGYGAHPDPAGALAPAIAAARATAAAAGRELLVVASVCGTAGDPQGLEAQRIKLTAAGAILAGSNAAAARLAADLARPAAAELEVAGTVMRDA